MKIKNHLGRLLLTLLVIFGLIFTVTYQDFIDDLHIKNITEELPFNPDWEVPPLPPTQAAQINHILKQPFTFIGEGGQSYVFESADHRFVLKLFKFKRFRPSWYIHWLPGTWFEDYRNTHIDRKLQKLYTVFNGHKLAYDQLRNESGLYFIQLNPSYFPTPATLIDRFGFARQIDLGETAYVIQEKGETLEENFSRLLKGGNRPLIDNQIKKVQELYLSEYQKGIYDLDHGVMHNIGFVGDKPLHMDVGKLVKDERMKSKEYHQADLDRVTLKMRGWLEKQQ